MRHVLRVGPIFLATRTAIVATEPAQPILILEGRNSVQGLDHVDSLGSWTPSCHGSSLGE